jgi:hypothetical protein
MVSSAALAASGLVSIERNMVSDATGSLASRLPSPARICSVACAAGRSLRRPGSPDRPGAPKPLFRYMA